MNAPAEPPADGGLSKETIVLITAIGGGLTALGLVLIAAIPPGAPSVAAVAATFVGSITLVVGAILGATSRRFASETRVGFGIGAGLSILLLLFVIVAAPAAATASPPICGVAAAGPGLLALRAFTMLRDVGL